MNELMQEADRQALRVGNPRRRPAPEAPDGPRGPYTLSKDAEHMMLIFDRLTNARIFMASDANDEALEVAMLRLRADFKRAVIAEIVQR